MKVPPIIGEAIHQTMSPLSSRSFDSGNQPSVDPVEQTPSAGRQSALNWLYVAQIADQGSGERRVGVW